MYGLKCDSGCINICLCTRQHDIYLDLKTLSVSAERGARFELCVGVGSFRSFRLAISLFPPSVASWKDLTTTGAAGGCQSSRDVSACTSRVDVEEVVSIAAA